jgi:hypothetical protein
MFARSRSAAGGKKVSAVQIKCRECANILEYLKINNIQYVIVHGEDWCER